MPKSPRPPAGGPPLDDVRSAFERLPTPDKVAFVLEATFGTIADALGETGRRAADALRDLDLDAAFRGCAPPRRPPATPPAAAPPAGTPPEPPPSA